LGTPRISKPMKSRQMYDVIVVGAGHARCEEALAAPLSDREAGPGGPALSQKEVDEF